MSSRLARTLLGAGAAAVLPLATEVRIGPAARPLTDRWRELPVHSRGATELGLSFRPRQAEALGLDVDQTLDTLLRYPFQVIRLGAYWDRIEPAPDTFDTSELDRQLAAAERAGKRVVLCAGAVKTFGYPEFFVPAHHLRTPLREGTLVRPEEHRALLAAAAAFIGRVVRRYRGHDSIIAWQVEHEAVDPLGMEHSWRLATAFVQAEVDAVRRADPGRPVLLNGFLPTSSPVRVQQWWRTRDQGDSLDVAQELADIIGIDFYPRHAVTGIGTLSAYFAGSASPWQQQRRRRIFRRAAERGQQVMVAEGQAEPWETVTVPPSPDTLGMYSCLPETVIENYNQCMNWTTERHTEISAYLFWGAEYWVMRARAGDHSYLGAFERVLNQGRS